MQKILFLSRFVLRIQTGPATSLSSRGRYASFSSATGVFFSLSLSRSLSLSLISSVDSLGGVTVMGGVE